MTTTPEEYEPRGGDGSIAAEDDSLLRQPADDTADEMSDPDTEQREARTSTGRDPVMGPDDPDPDIGERP